MIITESQLCSALGIKSDRASIWVDPLNETFARFGLVDPFHVSAFLAQIGHESARLSSVEENLNYSSNGLTSTFPKYFTHEQANDYARQPVKIANRVYADRMGNGDEISGDGFRYRGKGLLQVTGKENHAACGKALGLPLVDDPELLLEPINAALSAGWFWNAKKLNNLAELEDLRGITKVVNGGMNGFADRQLLYQTAKKALGA